MTKRDQDPLKTALHWRAKLADEEASDETRRAFGDWLLADPRNARAYDEAEQAWDALDAIRREDMDRRLLRPLASERMRASRLAFLRRLRDACAASPAAALASVAAVVVAIVASLLVRPAPPTAEPVERYAYETAIGEVRTVPLSDGSILTLGADSAVEVVFRNTVRVVRLNSGEAYFKVSSEAERPFVAMAGEMSARVTGTAFDMRPNGVLVSAYIAAVDIRTHPAIR